MWYSSTVAQDGCLQSILPYSVAYVGEEHACVNVLIV